MQGRCILGVLKCVILEDGCHIFHFNMMVSTVIASCPEKQDSYLLKNKRVHPFLLLLCQIFSAILSFNKKRKL